MSALDRETLTEATLDLFIAASDLTGWGSVVRTLVAEIRDGRSQHGALLDAADEVLTAFDNSPNLSLRSDIPWPSIERLRGATRHPVSLASGDTAE